MYDRIVAPLVEHARKVERETGRRITIDVAVCREDFDLIAAELGFELADRRDEPGCIAPGKMGPLLIHGGIILVSVKSEPLVFRWPADDERTRERLCAFVSVDD